MNHDQRFKILIQIFLLLLFKAWAERLDCTAVEWLDKEIFAGLDPRHAHKKSPHDPCRAGKIVPDH